jgi:hypothetical protein
MPRPIYSIVQDRTGPSVREGQCGAAKPSKVHCLAVANDNNRGEGLEAISVDPGFSKSIRKADPW